MGEVKRHLYSKYDGLYLSDERLRRYHKLGLFNAERAETSNFRIFNQDNMDRLEVVVSLIEIGVPISDIIHDNIDAIEKRINMVKEMVVMLCK